MNEDTLLLCKKLFFLHGMNKFSSDELKIDIIEFYKLVGEDILHSNVEYRNGKPYRFARFTDNFVNLLDNL